MTRQIFLSSKHKFTVIFTVQRGKICMYKPLKLNYIKGKVILNEKYENEKILLRNVVNDTNPKFI